MCSGPGASHKNVFRISLRQRGQKEKCFRPKKLIFEATTVEMAVTCEHVVSMGFDVKTWTCAENTIRPGRFL